jgi:type VII secretion protein EccB
MQTQKDQVQAYQFSTSRLVSAVATGETGAGQSPFRRSGLGTGAGIGVALLLAAGSVVWGLIHPVTSPAWKKPGAIVVNSATGTRFVYLGGELHPAANYASAMLASGGKSAVEVMSAADLAGVPYGSEIGISGAPETLPAAQGLLAGGWATCLDPANPGTTVLDLTPASQLGGAPPANERILVTGPTGAQYVVWNGAKYPLPSKSALAALGLGNADDLAASSTWLDALPTGPALVPAAIPRAGKRGPVIGGRPARIGDLFETTGSGVQQYYELRADGLAPIAGTELALLTATPGEPRPVQVGPADIAAVPASADKALLGGLPDLTSGSVYASGGPALCVHQASVKSVTGTLLTDSAARVDAVPVSLGTGVLVPQGDGMIVQPPSIPGQFGQVQTYLVTDTGEKYPLGGPNAQTALGYGAASAQVLPPQILNFLPTGPALTVPAARLAVTP